MDYFYPPKNAPSAWLEDIEILPKPVSDAEFAGWLIHTLRQVKPVVNCNYRLHDFDDTAQYMGLTEDEYYLGWEYPPNVKPLVDVLMGALTAAAKRVRHMPDLVSACSTVCRVGLPTYLLELRDNIDNGGRLATDHDQIRAVCRAMELVEESAGGNERKVVPPGQPEQPVKASRRGGRRVAERGTRPRYVPKQIEMKGRAKSVEEAIYAELLDDTGKSLTEILRACEVSHETFNSSENFKEARAAWGTLTTRRAQAQYFRRDDDANVESE
ncbi:MAG: hypothetical protein ACYSVY_15920 [Planctomycetota bacterium]|jgi:hypothetical protein